MGHLPAGTNLSSYYRRSRIFFCAEHFDEPTQDRAIAVHFDGAGVCGPNRAGPGAPITVQGQLPPVRPSSSRGDRVTNARKDEPW